MHTGIPLWAAILIAVVTALLSFAGSYGGHMLARKGAKELEKRSKREEALRVLRWAAELAVDEDDRRVALGVAQLETLIESAILDVAELGFVAAALAVVYETPVREIDDFEQAGEDVAVELMPEHPALPTEAENVQDAADRLRAEPTHDADEARQRDYRALPSRDLRTDGATAACDPDVAVSSGDESAPSVEDSVLTLGGTEDADEEAR